MKHLLSILCALLISGMIWGQTTYYVEKNGLDTNSRPGTSVDKAWATITYALQKAESGSIIQVGEGLFILQIPIS